MDSRPINVFFYGLFMDAEALRANGFHPVNARQACVPGMSLQIGRRATLVPDPARCAYGFVIGLSHAEVGRLYAEPSVAAYRPEAVIAAAQACCHPREWHIAHPRTMMPALYRPRLTPYV